MRTPHDANLRAAGALLEAARRCDPENEPPETQGDMGIPAIVCAALSAELSLKVLALQVGVKSRGHDLRVLLERLPAHLQVQVREGTLFSSAEFEKHLENARHAFVEWRYAYESEDLLLVHIGFLMALATALHEVASRIENAA